jgi:hypothetical protein
VKDVRSRVAMLISMIRDEASCDRCIFLQTTFWLQRTRKSLSEQLQWCNVLMGEMFTLHSCKYPNENKLGIDNKEKSAVEPPTLLKSMPRLRQLSFYPSIPYFVLLVNVLEQVVSSFDCLDIPPHLD